jgi:hypothetical protein
MLLASFNTDWSDLGVLLAVVVGAASCGIVLIDFLAAVAGAFLATAASKQSRRRGWLLGLLVGIGTTTFIPVVFWFSIPFTWALMLATVAGAVAAFISAFLIGSQTPAAPATHNEANIAAS